MFERRFLLKNNNWKEYMQPGEVTKEGSLSPEVNLFIAQEGVNSFLFIDSTFNQQIPKEEREDLREVINSQCKVSVKTIVVSGNLVKAELTIKRDFKEFVYLISHEDAENLFKLCAQPLQTYCKYIFGMKKSYFGIEDPQIWWIKEYSGPYAGITFTGVELKDSKEELILPDWAGKEISNDPENMDAQLFSLKPTKIEQVLGVYRT